MTASFKARSSLLHGIQKNGSGGASTSGRMSEDGNTTDASTEGQRREHGATSATRASITTMLNLYSKSEERITLLFDVVKSYRKWYQTRSQLRSFEIDFHNATLRNLGRSGRLRKAYAIGDLVRLERLPEGGVHLRFSSANHAFILHFQRNDQHTAPPEAQAELFYQLLTAMAHECRRLSPSSSIASPSPNHPSTSTSDAASTATLMNNPACSTAIRPVERVRMTVLIGTFNVGNAQPPEDLAPWLTLGGGTCADLYVIGTQECVYEPRESESSTQRRPSNRRSSWLSSPSHSSSSSPSFAGDSPHTMASGASSTSRCERHFVSNVMNWLGDGYTLVAYKSMVITGSMRVLVACRKELAYAVRGVHAGTMGTGVANMYGNKGGVCVSLFVHETMLSFFNMHLASGVNKAADRNADAEAVMDMRLGPNPDVCVMSQSDHTFVFGDLNYRCTCAYDDGVGLAVKGLTERGQAGNQDGQEGVVPGHTPLSQKGQHMRSESYATLFEEYDELSREMQAGTVFENFKEGEITFGPTYRYQRGSRLFSRKKEQSPSYTDRVLSFSTAHSSDLQQLGYWSAPGVTTSDHSPVAALFSFPVTLPMSSRDIVSHVTSVSGRHKLLRGDEGYTLELRSLEVDEIASAKTHISIAATTHSYGMMPHKCNSAEMRNGDDDEEVPPSSSSSSSTSSLASAPVRSAQSSSSLSASETAGSNSNGTERDSMRRCSDAEDQQHPQQQRHHQHRRGTALQHGVSDLEGIFLRTRFCMHGGLTSSRQGNVSEYAETEVVSIGNGDVSEHHHRHGSARTEVGNGENGQVAIEETATDGGGVRNRVRCSWDKMSLPVIRPNCTGFQALVHKRLLISVEGYRGVHSYSIGSCAFELSELDEEDAGREIAFINRPLYKGGVINGRVSLRLALRCH